MLASWTQVGPSPILDGQVSGLTAQQNPVAGAVQVVAPHPTDANILYIGAVNGGIWRTDNAQSASPNWAPLIDDQPSLSIGDLQFDPTDATHNTLIAGIGRFSSLARDGDDLTGLLRTTDGGQTWTSITGGGVMTGKNVTATEARGSVIVAAINGATPFSLDNVGIFRSNDGGATFTHINGAAGSGLPLGRALEMVPDPSDPQVLYSSLTDAGSNNGIYKSSDAGASWARVSSDEMNALILDTGDRTSNVQMSVGNSDNVFVGIINSGQLAGFFRSGDGGAGWTAMDIPVTNENGTDVGLNPIKTGPKKPDGQPADDPGGQGAIHFSVAADPSNPNIVYAGGDRQPRGALDQGQFPNSIGAVNFTGRLFRGDASLGSGSQWTPLTDNFADPDGTGPLPGTAPHADSRDMQFDAAGDLIEGDDGGVYKRANSTSDTGVWSSLNGSLQITEFVSVAYSSLSHTTGGGAQDVGSSLQSTQGSTTWLQVTQGDGGYVAVDDDSQPGASIRYGSAQFLGNFGSITVDANNNLIGSDSPALIVNGTGGQTIFEVDAPQFYTPIELNTVDPARLVFGMSTRVFETFDRGETVSDLGEIGTTTTFAYGGNADGSGNADVLYVGTDQGMFLRSTSGGAIAPLNAYPGGVPQDVAIDPDDWRRAVVVDSDSVYTTIDAGASWDNVTGNLVDSQLRTVEIIVALGKIGVLAGGNSGVSILRLGDASFWSEAAEGLAGAPVIDLHYNVVDDVIIAGTLGRGAWIVSNGSEVLVVPGLGVDDVAQLEGNGGFTAFVFTVSQPSNPVEVTVAFATIDGTAEAGTDYIAQSGSLTFAPNETIQTITIQVVADLTVEQDEVFLLRLSDASNGDISKPDGVGTIINDDVDVSIGDATLVEGNSGTRNMVFTISIFGTLKNNATVSYSTLNDTASGGADYLPRAGVVNLSPQVTTATISVPIVGDRLDEGNEQVLAVLVASVGVRIEKSVGIGTIIDDDATPSLYVNDVQVTSNTAGTESAVFTIALDSPSGRDVLVDYSTLDGGALNTIDYVGQQGTLTIPAGAMSRQVTVPIMTSGVPQPDKTFFLQLSSAQNALMGDGRGAATIVFADSVESRIVDNGDAGSSHTGNGWTNLTNTLAYGLDYDYHTAGTGNAAVTWSFPALVNGSYEVFARWIPFVNRATNAPYTIVDGSASFGSTLGTVAVNQQVAPSGQLADGVVWQSLGTYSINSNTLTVRLTNNANGLVVADAIRIVGDGLVPQVAEINVAGVSQSIGTGDTTPALIDGTEFGETSLNTGSQPHTFTITNSGNTNLVLSGSPPITITGAHAAEFVVTSQPATTVLPGGSTTFEIEFHPQADGLRQAVVSIANNDGSENPYTFAVQGTGLQTASPFAHNFAFPQDVNADSRVSPIDLLIVINHMLDRNAEPAAAPLATTSSAPPEAYVDVNADGRLSPIDVLAVINYLLDQSTAAVPSTAALTQSAPDSDSALAAVAVDTAIQLSGTSPADPLAAPLGVELAPSLVVPDTKEPTVPSSTVLNAAAVGASLADDDESDEAADGLADLALEYLDN